MSGRCHFMKGLAWPGGWGSSRREGCGSAKAGCPWGSWLGLSGGLGSSSRVPGWNHSDTDTGVAGFPGRGKGVQLLESHTTTPHLVLSLIWFDSQDYTWLVSGKMVSRSHSQPDREGKRPLVPRLPAAQLPALLGRGLLEQKGLSGSLWREYCPSPSPGSSVPLIAPGRWPGGGLGQTAVGMGWGQAKGSVLQSLMGWGPPGGPEILVLSAEHRYRVWKCS